MAEPIQFRKIQPDPMRDVRAKLDAAPLQHADAVLSAYALLQELQDHGVLDLLRGAVGAGGGLTARLAEAANTPEAIAAMRNLISLLRILGSIDPEILHGVADIVTQSGPAAPEAPGIASTLRRVFGKEGRRALGAAAYGVQAFGRVLIARQLKKP